MLKNTFRNTGVFFKHSSNAFTGLNKMNSYNKKVNVNTNFIFSYFCNRFTFFNYLNKKRNCSISTQNIPLKDELQLIKVSNKGLRSMKSKRKLRMPNTKYKMKTHNALKKRIRIVGRFFDRGFKQWANNHSHKMINKSNANLEKKKKPRYISKVDIRHAKRMLPYFRRKKYKH
jgi:ribosomal protein L35